MDLFATYNNLADLSFINCRMQKSTILPLAASKREQVPLIRVYVGIKHVATKLSKFECQLAEPVKADQKQICFTDMFCNELN